MLIAALACGCGDSSSAVLLTLVPNADINTKEQLVKLVKTLQLEFDASEGLYPQGYQDARGNQQVADFDGDGWPELRVKLTLKGKLPTILIERGALNGSRLQLIIEGHGVNGTLIAKGGLQSFAMPSDGSMEELDVYFNMIEELWPPQVTQTIPANGARDIPVALDAVDVFFSKAMDGNSLVKEDAIQLFLLQGAQEKAITPNTRRVITRKTDIGTDVVGLRLLVSPLENGSYRLRVNPSTRSITGVTFDQMPAVEGNQPYVATFSISDQAIPAAGMPPDFGEVKQDALCAEVSENCPYGYHCADVDGERRCVPSDCGCEAPFVCNAQNLCVAPCQVTGCANNQVCNEDSGLCSPL